MNESSNSEVWRRRYSRQQLLPVIGLAGQKKLAESSVVILGCGALGSAQANLLARAGVGRLRVVDRDYIEDNNLQRQLLYTESDIAEGLPKAEAAARALRAINSSITVEGVVADVHPANIALLVKDFDIVLDGLDNFETRYLLNDVCIQLNKPWVYGAAVGTYGLSMTIVPRKTPCLRCLFEVPPPVEVSPTCDTAGVLGTITTLIATVQATEALKWLVERRDALSGALFQADLWNNEFRQLDVTSSRRADCPACAQGKLEYLSAVKTSYSVVLCGRDAVQIQPEGARVLEFAKLADKLKRVGRCDYNAYMLRFETERCQISVFPDGRAIIKGVTDETQARSLYAKYVGA